jgi:bifunctional non-homologous end joining protein LigD
MLLQRTSRLPESSNLAYELKWDGYRAIAFKTAGKAHLRSRNDNDFATRYRAVARALAALPDETVIDGEIVALDESGRPSFNMLQNYTSGPQSLLYYLFNVMVLAGRDVMSEPLTTRRQLLHDRVLSTLDEPIRESSILDAKLNDVIQAVKAQGLEGIVAKRSDSRYEPGQRSGAWQKMRVNQGQEFVIGGYTPGPHGLDAVVFGLLRRRAIDIRRPHPQRIHASIATTAIPAIPGA